MKRARVDSNLFLEESQEEQLLPTGPFDLDAFFSSVPTPTNYKERSNLCMAYAKYCLARATLEKESEKNKD